MVRSAFLLLVVSLLPIIMARRNISVAVKARSVGCFDECTNCQSHAEVNGVLYTHNHPGLRIVVIDSTSGNVEKSGNFKDLKLIARRENLKIFLANIKSRSIVVLTLQHKCSANNPGWYKLVQQYSNFTLNDMDTKAYESAIIVTCQHECPQGAYSQNIPLYRFEQGRYGPLQELLNITIFIDSPPKASTQAVIEDHTSLFRILGSLSAICLIIIMVTVVCFFCKRYHMKAINRPPRTTESTKIDAKLKNWIRQKHQDNINKEINKSQVNEHGRREFDNRAFHGDVVRFSITSVDTFSALSTTGILTDAEVLQTACNIDIVQDNCMEKENQIGRTAIPQQEEHHIYLEPIEQNDRGLKRTSVHLYSKLKDALRPSKKSKLHNINSDSVKYAPSSSFQLFHSMEENKNKRETQSLSFAEYLTLEKQLYKKPSNVIKHDPPTHPPEDIPCPSLYTVYPHDYDIPSSKENFPRGDLEQKRERGYTSLSESYAPEIYEKLAVDAIAL